MAVPRRRSARLNHSGLQRDTPGRRTPLSAISLGSVLERDETPDVAEQQQSIDNVVETPASAATIKEQLIKLSSLSTPKTEPRPERGLMHPKTIQTTTANAPDSGLKLGFVDIPPQPRTLPSLQNTPSKSRDRTAEQVAPPKFEFHFGSETQLSKEAQKLMENVRDEAARIKVQMQAEKSAQDKKDDEAEQMFKGMNGSGRKIAKPKGKSGRFSDVHMAQFKKMDSIANHASSYRTRQGFAQPTTQSLKRSGSKAGLDDLERPRTSGKGTPGRAPPPFLGRPSTVSPFKSIPRPHQPSDRQVDITPTKRQRRSEAEDVSAVRKDVNQSARPLNIPLSKSSNLLSPTKASLARSSQIPTSSPRKESVLSKSSSTKSLRSVSQVPISKPAFVSGAPVVQTYQQPPFTQIPVEEPPPAIGTAMEPTRPEAASRRLSKSNSLVATASKPTSFSSRLPTFSGLKSILRPNLKPSASKPSNDRPGTPKRPNTATRAGDSSKKVDFTPSVKSRYAVKLAASSPSPAKLPHLTPAKISSDLVFPYDPSAYVIEDEEDENWEDAESEIEYPALPDIEAGEGPVVNTFTEKAKNHNRRESKEFKSIFTTLHHPSRTSASTLTSVNTTMNQTNPTAHANQVVQSPSSHSMSKPSPSTIRRVRQSGVTDLVQPFEDTDVKTMPHGLPGKKRRRTSVVDNDKHGMDEDAKENRRISVMPQVPGGWEDSVLDEDEGDKRSGKRARVSKIEEPATKKAETKKPNAAREAAAKNAKERKGKGILSLSRLNMLSRPKQRG